MIDDLFAQLRGARATRVLVHSKSALRNIPVPSVIPPRSDAMSARSGALLRLVRHDHSQLFSRRPSTAATRVNNFKATDNTDSYMPDNSARRPIPSGYGFQRTISRSMPYGIFQLAPKGGGVP